MSWQEIGPLLVNGLGAVAAVATLASLVALAALARHRASARAWLEAAATLGVTGATASSTLRRVRMTGRVDGFDLLVESTTRTEKSHDGQGYEAVPGTRIALSAPDRLPHRLDLRREDISSAVEKLLKGSDVETGDYWFDERVLVWGHPVLVSALLDARTRRGVMDLVEAGGRVKRGVITRSFPEDVTEPDRLVLLLGGLLDVARLLVEPSDPARRLADNARNDPSWQVRAKNLERLIERFPGRELTRATCRDLLQDREHPVRLTAARHLGPEGRATLLDIAANPAGDEAGQVEAIEALGNELPLELGLAILDLTVGSSRHRQAAAAMRALALHPDLEARRRLRSLTQYPDDETAAAAVRALGETGEPAEERVLLSGLQRGPHVVSAVVTALGRIGTASSVPVLFDLAARHPLDIAQRGEITRAVAAIQARIGDAAQGRLAIAEGASGALSLAAAEPGRVTLAGSGAARPGPRLPDRRSTRQGGVIAVEGGLFALLAVAAAFGAFLYRISKVGRVLKEWSEAAAALHLEDVSTSGLLNPTLRGVADGLEVTVESDSRNQKQTTTIAIKGKGRFPRNLALRREGIATALGKLFGGEDIQTGDNEFDAAVLLRGEEAFAVAVMTGTTRAAVLRAVNYGSTLADGTLRREVDRELGRARDLEDLLRTQLKLARALLPSRPTAEQLALNARTEADPKVRLRNLEALIAAFPGAVGTAEAIEAGLADSSPRVRLRAATALPEKGHGVLVALAGDPAPGDDMAARAVAALGGAIPLDLAVALLDPARLEGFTARTAATLKAAAAIPDLDDVGRRRRAAALAAVVPAVSGEVAVAAIEALGSCGDASDQPVLLAALERTSPAIRAAAADALARIGTVETVPLLHAIVAGAPLEIGLRILVGDAIAAIKARRLGAGEGQVTLADGDAGQLALFDASPGTITLTQHAATPSLPDEGEHSAPRPGPRGRSREGA